MIKYDYVEKEGYLHVTVNTPILTANFDITKEMFEEEGYTEDGISMSGYFEDMLELENNVENAYLNKEHLYNIVYHNARALYDAITSDEDFYCEEEGIYVWHYNDNAAIAYYTGITKEYAAELSRKAKTTGEYWENIIPFHGYIIDHEDSGVCFCENLIGKPIYYAATYDKYAKEVVS